MQVFPFKRENWEKQDLEYNPDFGLQVSYETGSVISKAYQRFHWTKKTYQ